MEFIKTSLKIGLLSLLTFGLTAPAFAIPDNDNGIRAADFAGNLNSGQGFIKITGNVTATDDLEDVKQVLLTGRSNLRLIGEGVAPNGGRTDLLLVRDANNNGRIDQGETIGRSQGSFSHQITRQNLAPGFYYVIIRSKQFNSSKVEYQVTVDARV